MSRWLGLSLLLVSCCQFLIVCGIKTNAAERAALIEAAINEAKEQASHAAHAGGSKSTTLQRHRAFKLAYPSTLAQGKARLLYEDMVHRAERKILESRRRANSASLEKNNEAMAEALATELLHRPGSLLNREEIAKIYEESQCKELVQAPDCRDPSVQKFRTADGTCNNLKNPTYGAADTPFRRLILPQYEDGISAPRGWLQSTGSSLFAGPFSPPNPSPRVVSLGVVSDRPAIEDRYTHILMQWGQFMDHDLDFAPEFESCPAKCDVESPETLECAPFPLPRDDTSVMVTRTDPESRGCHLFRRSLPACEEAAPSELSSREQINGITAFIDGSQVYHHNERVMNDLIRDKSSGKGQLRVGLPVPGTTRPSLPFVNESGIVACPSPLTPSQCYLAGDLRVNEQTALTVMHTIWVREHNRIATALSALNPQWDDERLFQEARQIVIAQIQKITYKDYLPLVIGDLLPELILNYSLQGYNNQTNPNIPNAFATAAYRFGHSQIQPFFDRLDENYNPRPQGPLNLVDAFFTPTRFVESGGTDPILRGLVTKQARFVDEFLNSILTNQLFASNGSVPGLDLASLNIQRGRDHGLPPYLTWKRWALEQCGHESEFRNELTKIHLLQTYGTLETVDLFVGGLSEEPLKGGLVGATFACIFARTFGAVRDGDRFYYENDDATTGIFTASQRSEIEKASLSRVICDTSDNIQRIQPNAFLANQNRVSCSGLPQINLNAWQQSVPPPPSTCYMRIGIEDKTILRRRHHFDALSGFSNNDSDIHFSQVRVRRSEESECLSIRCPTQSQDVDLAAYSFLSTCTVDHNTNLPTSEGVSFLGIYIGTIDSSHVTETSGIYLSKESCGAGATNALDFVCNGLQANEQNEDEKLVQSLEHMLHTQQDSGSEPTTEEPPSRIDKDINPGDPILNDAPEEVRKVFSNSPSGGGNEKLISVMENVLKELKTQNNKKSMDDKLVSELSDALARI